VTVIVIGVPEVAVEGTEPITNEVATPGSTVTLPEVPAGVPSSLAPKETIPLPRPVNPMEKVPFDSATGDPKVPVPPTELEEKIIFETSGRLLGRRFP